MAKFCGKCGTKLDEQTGKCPNCEKEVKDKQKDAAGSAYLILPEPFRYKKAF